MNVEKRERRVVAAIGFVRGTMASTSFYTTEAGEGAVVRINAGTQS